MSLAGKGLWRTVEIDDPLDALNPLGSANVIVCTIGPAGGTDNNGNSFDYNTLNAWLADVQAYEATQHTDRDNIGPITIVGSPFWAECYGGANLTTTWCYVNITNYDATNTHFVRIYAAPGHRANGLFDARGFYDDVDVPQGAYCKVSNSGSVIQSGQSAHMRIEGLRLMGNEAAGAQVSLTVSDHCLLQANTIQTTTVGTQFGKHGIIGTLDFFGQGTSADRTVIFRNNVICSDGSGKDTSGILTLVWTRKDGQALRLFLHEDNNTLMNLGGAVTGELSGLFHNVLMSSPYTGTAETILVRRNNLSLKPAAAYACYVDQKSGPQPGNVTFSYAADEYNLSNDGTADDFGNTTPGSCMTNVDAADVVRDETADAALKRGSPAVGTGIDLSGVFGQDLRGRERTQWDLGASAYASGAHGATSTHPSSIATTL